MRPAHTAAALILTALLAGCASGADTETPEPVPPVETPAPQETDVEPDIPTVPVTDECRDALADAATAYDEMSADPDATLDELDALELPALTACETAAQWISAARENPELIDWSAPEDVTALDLQARCGASAPGREAPVCQDALDAGLVE